MTPLERLWNRPDFRAHPVRALYRRAHWRWRWLWNNKPWPLRTAVETTLLAPRGGAGALIYYQGCSEPETAAFLCNALRPGMNFFDVGAHIGEYTLLAGRSVGPEGSVHAFEPQPDTYELLQENLRRNHAANVKAVPCAIAAECGLARFRRHPEPSQSTLDPGGDITVPTRTLPDYVRETGVLPHVIKVDVEGAECEVLKGALPLLGLSPGLAPLWVLEYSAENYRRFGASVSDLRRLLESAGYHLCHLSGVPVDRFSPTRTFNLAAVKGEWFR